MKSVAFLVRSAFATLLLAGIPALADSYNIIPISVPGAQSTQALAINNKGQIVGTYNDTAGTHAFIDTNGSYTTFGLAGFIPYGINDSGQIAGGSLGVGTVSGSFTAIQPPKSIFFEAEALGINNAGQVVGQLDASMTIGAFLYSGGAISILSNSATPRGINNSGEIVGWAVIGNPFTDGVKSFFTINGVSTTLTAPGAFVTMAAAVNDSGQIVGTFNPGPGLFGGVNQGFVYDNGVFTDFSIPGSNGDSLTGINDSGELIGNYADSDFVSHAFLAIPESSAVPEPACLSFAGIALCGLGILRYRRRPAA